jgi:hypothetical protein
MKFKLSGIEIESDKIVSSISFNINYEEENVGETGIINADKGKEKVEYQKGNIFEENY